MSRSVDNLRGDRQHPRESNSLQWALVVVILLLGFALRIGFAVHVDPFVDEYTSTLAMESVARHGLPILPSGLIYSPKGLLHSYLGGAVIRAFGVSGSPGTLSVPRISLRFISIAASMMGICCAYRMGSDWFSPTAGLMAAAALATLPSNIEWGARIRPYALLQTLCLIGGYLVLDTYTGDRDHRTGIVAALVLIASVLAHPLGTMMIGGLLAATTAFRLVSPSGRRWPPSLTAWEVAAGILLVAAVIIFTGTLSIPTMQGPWGVHGTLQDTAHEFRALSNLQDVAIYSLMFTQHFLTWPLWPLTLLYVLGLVTLLYRAARRNPEPDDSIILALYTLTVSVWLLTSALSSGLYHHRYLLHILPFYLLLAAREWQRLLGLALELISPRGRARSPLPTASTLIVAVFYLPSALGIIRH